MKRELCKLSTNGSRNHVDGGCLSMSLSLLLVSCSAAPGNQDTHPQLLFSHSVGSNSLSPCGPQHARLPCPSLSPGVCSNSCPLSRWCHPTISSSVVPFSSCPQSLPGPGSLPNKSDVRRMGETGYPYRRREQRKQREFCLPCERSVYPSRGPRVGAGSVEVGAVKRCREETSTFTSTPNLTSRANHTPPAEESHNHGSCPDRRGPHLFAVLFSYYQPSHPAEIQRRKNDGGGCMGGGGQSGKWRLGSWRGKTIKCPKLPAL